MQSPRPIRSALSHPRRVWSYLHAEVPGVLSCPGTAAAEPRMTCFGLSLIAEPRLPDRTTQKLNCLGSRLMELNDRTAYTGTVWLCCHRQLVLEPADKAPFFGDRANVVLSRWGLQFRTGKDHHTSYAMC